MKVIQVPFGYYPDPLGGTEIYVAALSRELVAQGVSVLVAAPGSTSDRYIHDDIPVVRYRTSPSVPLVDLYGNGDLGAVAAFDRILAAEAPDVLHLHALTSGVSTGIAQAAKKRGIPVAFTFHTPTATCQRGTLMRMGRTICDGVINVRRCAGCTLQAHGLNESLSWCLSHVPEAAGDRLLNAGRHGGVWTALAMTALMRQRRRSVKRFFDEVNSIVAVCEWGRNLLIRNGVDSAKITLSRQGVAHSPEFPASERRRDGRPLAIAFLGRMHPTKGVDILVEAILRRPQLPVRCDIYGVVQDEEGRKVRQSVEARASSDGRIRFLPPVPPEDAVRTIRNYDALAVPSQWLETGPLVVYEAYAAGVPVIGSRLGGIAEIVEDGRTGLLVEPASVTAWSIAIARLIEEPGLVEALSQGVPVPRTMCDAASEMMNLYRCMAGSCALHGPITQ